MNLILAIIRECPEQSGLRTHYSQVTDDSRIRVSAVAAAASSLNARIAALRVLVFVQGIFNTLNVL